jgi:hypothetical protein
MNQSSRQTSESTRLSRRARIEDFGRVDVRHDNGRRSLGGTARLFDGCEDTVAARSHQADWHLESRNPRRRFHIHRWHARD